MTDQQATLLCGYGYDPLDRLVSCAPQNHQTIQRFYRVSASFPAFRRVGKGLVTMKKNVMR